MHACYYDGHPTATQSWSLKEHESELHVLINNAGATWGASFDDYPDKAWERVFNLNVRSVFNLTQLAAPMLQAAAEPGDPARVINISSVR